MKIVNLEKLTNSQFLNMFKLTYEEKGKNYNYYFVSRRDGKNLSINNPNFVHIDAVEILPYFVENKKIKVVLIKEFRYPLNRYIYSIPAGLVEDGENLIISAKRELFEEIGAKVKSIEKIASGFVSAGLTDETTICYEAEIGKLGGQHLEQTEKIKVKVVDLDKLEEFIHSHTFTLKSALLLKNFIYKKKLEKLEAQKELLQ